MRIEFTVPGVPVAQPRQRIAVRGNHATAYTPTKHPVNSFKASVQLAAAHAYSGAPLAGCLIGSIDCVLPRPKTLCWKTKPMPRMRHSSKPDCDNLAKSVLDALSGLLFGDDRQFSSLTISKWIASGNEQPHVVVTVQQVAE